MKKVLVVLFPLVLLCLFVWESEGSYLGRKLGIAIPQPISWETADDHGGFHGDGLRTDILKFSPEDGDLMEAHIRSRGDLWNAGSFDDYLGAIIYRGGHGATEAGWPRHPEKAYWFFKDRHSQKEKALHERYSWNYTAALYDADTNTLYYLEFDT